MQVGSLVVAWGGPLQRLQDLLPPQASPARGVGDGGEGGQLQGVEGDASVAAGRPAEQFQRVLVHLHLQVAQSPLGVGQGAQDDGPYLLGRQRLQHVDATA